MNEQLIEMGFSQGRGKHIVYYGLDHGTLWIHCGVGLVKFEDMSGCITTLARNATIEQISNILKSIHI